MIKLRKNIINFSSEVSRSDWMRRWLYSTNAKDIGILYLYFAIFSGIIMPLKNLAICWRSNLFNWQLAENFNKKRILRDFAQELSLFKRFYREKNSQVGYYLAGLIEADGSIIVPKEDSKNTPTISISFNIIDKPLAICIKNQLGFGSIENIENSNAVRLIIRGKYNILTLVNLINGKFRTPKIEKLHSLIDYINNKWNKTVIPLSLDTGSFDENSWLAGFSDGDASLGINITWPNESINKYGQIRLTFELVQSRINEEHLFKYKIFMNKLSIFFNSKLETHYISKFDRGGKQKAWRARISNKKGATVVVNYFDKFPMFSCKFMNYKDWRLAYDILILKKEHIGGSENKLNTFKKVGEIKNNMNKMRVNFDWSHLKYFYK